MLQGALVGLMCRRAGSEMYAVIRTGGKQYRIAEGDRVRVEKLDAVVGSKIEFLDVLLVGGDECARVGTPLLEDARVRATVIDQGKYRKILVFKHKRRKGYRRRQGHRQLFTEVEITGIEAP